MVVYRTLSFFQIIVSLFFRLACIAGGFIALLHFNENPVVISIVVFICLVFFLIGGVDEIIVYNDVVKYKSKSLVRIFNVEKRINISDIKSVTIEGDFEAGDELRTSDLYFEKRKELNKFIIILKNGDSVTIATDLYIAKLKEVAIEINKLLK